jgi:hypothetical protein
VGSTINFRYGVGTSDICIIPKIVLNPSEGVRDRQINLSALRNYDKNIRKFILEQTDITISVNWH